MIPLQRPGALSALPPLSLYVHLPWCLRKCPYCDFNSHEVRRSDTGNLDTASSSEVFALMRRIHEQVGTTFLVVTHDTRLAARCDRVIELVDGALASDGAPAPG